MLQKFLFVGVGGSGGKTLRMLYENLENRLALAGHRDGVPRAWQFLHVDVPMVPDGEDADLPGQLPAGRYVGTAPSGMNYRSLDAMIENRGPAAARHVASWRPDAQMVAVAPAFGAGQFRAVGRIITGAGLGTVVEALKRSASALEDVAVDQELDRVSQAMTGKSGISKHYPQVVVISSIAGGAGAGAFLDVCDALRQLMPDSRDQISAVLYTPDVFRGLKTAAKSGVNANALAVMNELLAGYWNNEGPSEDEFALLEAAGVAVHEVERRGPNQTFLVGRSNGEIALTGQIDVYRAIARALTAWTSDPEVQDAMNVGVIGNWDSKSRGNEDRSKLAPTRGTAFSAMGYASVDLGRERFARYAAKRLARASIERLLRGHWGERVPQEVTPEFAAQEVANDQLYSFLDACGLNELGPVHNQIIDAIRGGVEEHARTAKLAQLRQDVVRDVAGGSAEVEVSLVMKKIEGRISDAWHSIADGEYEDDKERARIWYAERQDLVCQQVAELLGRVGGPATAKILELAIAELTSAVVPELNQMTEANRRVVGTTDQRIHSVFANTTGKLMADNPLIPRGVQEGLDSLHAEAEARLYELCGRLIIDLCAQFLEPLRTAVLHAVSGLEEAATGQPSSPSVVDSWPVDVPPRFLEPAQNELLLEPVSSYSQTFLQLVRQTVGMPDEQGALLEAVLQAVAGSDAKDRQQAITITRRWVPSQQVLRTRGASTSATFRIDLEPLQLLERTREWVGRRDSAIGMHVNESFSDYLSGKDIDPGEHSRRLDAFRAAFQNALNIAKPLIEIDPALNAHFHGDTDPEPHRVMSRIPFPRNHPGREVVGQVLHGLTEQQLENLFEDSKRQRIDITTFLDAPVQPMVLSSLVGPIANEWVMRRGQDSVSEFWRWRRARPLRHAVPVDPKVRRAMIRGWFVARLLDQIELVDPRDRAVTILHEDGTKLSFPFPLLGPPITRNDQVLPAILETMGLAIALDPKESLKPYERLFELGKAVKAEGHDTVPKVFDRWFRDGEVARGAPTPTVDGRVGPNDGRAEREIAVKEYFRIYVDHYAELSTFDLSQFDFSLRHVEMLRVWELAQEIGTELTELRTAISRIPVSGAPMGPG
jgi:hypothetical protein